MVNNTLRRMAYGENTLYWYFLPLPDKTVPLDRYKIREVVVTDPVVDKNGYVKDYSSAVPVDNGGTVSLEGKQKGESVKGSFDYTVLYTTGTVDADSNVRVDEVLNNRPGIVIRKEDWSGSPLAGAKFELKDSDGTLIGEFTSDSEGLITVAFLGDDKDYTLTETDRLRTQKQSCHRQRLMTGPCNMW